MANRIQELDHIATCSNESIAQLREAHEKASSEQAIALEKKVSRTAFPNLGLAIAKLGIAHGNQTNQDMRSREREIRVLSGNTKQLLAVNKHLPVGRDEPFVITEEVRSLLTQLEELGISLLKDPNVVSLTKEEVLALKADITAHTDRLQLDLKTQTMEMQTRVSEQNTIHSSIVTALRLLDRLGSILTKNQRV